MNAKLSPRAAMADLLARRKQSFSLPQEFYADPAFHELDLEAIFHRRWIFAGAECELPRAGDYFTLTIGRTPIMVLRDGAGTVRAFFNTCRHRGSKICVSERGSVKKLVCPYHQWMYDLDGRLVTAGRMHEAPDPDLYGLKPVNVQTVGGTIYVCLAAEAPDFSAYRSVLGPYLAPHDLANAKLAHETNAVVNGNWKLVMENSRECYHCPARHPELMRSFLESYDFEDPSKDQAVARFWAECAALGLPSAERHGEEFRLVRLPFIRGAVSITMEGGPASSRLLGQIPGRDIGSLRWVHYPSSFNHALADYAILIRMLPIAPQQTLFTAKWLVHRDAEAGRDYDLASLIQVWDVTNEQDQQLVERNQEGVNSLGYEPGPYSRRTEVGVIRFVEWYCETMARFLEPEPRMAAAAD